MLNDVDRTQRWGHARFPAEASTGSVRRCDPLRIGHIGQRLRNWAFRPTERSAWSRSARAIGRFGGGKGFGLEVYGKILAQRLGIWVLVIVVDE